MTDDASDPVAHHARTLQTIIGGLATGSLVFAGAALMFGGNHGAESFLSRMAMIAGLVAIAAHSPVAKSLRAKRAPESNPLGAYVVSVIVSAAILEGAIFFNLIAHFMEKSNWTIAMAALLWVVLLTKMPTRGGIQDWLDRDERERRDDEAFDA